MPIHIDEIAVTVEVTNAESGGASTPLASDAERKALVAECVEQVLELLRRGREP